jgi:hypothetical protein
MKQTKTTDLKKGKQLAEAAVSQKGGWLSSAKERERERERGESSISLELCGRKKETRKQIKTRLLCVGFDWCWRKLQQYTTRICATKAPTKERQHTNKLKTKTNKKLDLRKLLSMFTHSHFSKQKKK